MAEEASPAVGRQPADRQGRRRRAGAGLIAAMPGWKSEVGRRLDALIERNVPGVRKAVKWNSPFYGAPGRGLVPLPPCLRALREGRVLPRRGAEASPTGRVQGERRALSGTSTRRTGWTKIGSPTG